MGEGNIRQVVSGLAKFCSPEELTVSILPQIRENHDCLNIRFKCLKFFFNNSESPRCADYKREAWKAARCNVCWVGMFQLLILFVQNSTNI